MRPAFDTASPAMPLGQRDVLLGAIERTAVDADVEPLAVSRALASILRTAAGEPLMIAIDYVQRMDEGSSQVLTFAFRRLGHEPVRLLALLLQGSSHGRRTSDRCARACCSP